MRAAGLLERHRGIWEEAIRHPFLDGVREGGLPDGAFDTWLAQDYLYVSDLLAFQARLLARTPREAQGIVAGGLVALIEELDWFEALAGERGLALDAPRQPAAVAYRDLLSDLERGPYPAAMTALWAIELAYLEAWTSAKPGSPNYTEYVEHWTTPEFASYVSGLGEAADAALRGASEDERERAERAFLAVARLERDFWEMAFSGGGGA